MVMSLMVFFDQQYSYDVSKWKRGDEEAEEDKAWTGESEPAPEGGVEQAVTLEGEHALPSDPEQLAALLLDLVRQPMQFKVTCTHQRPLPGPKFSLFKVL